MSEKIYGQEYKVVLNKKKIKNTYIRVNDSLEIVVSSPIFASKKDISVLINKNEDKIYDMIKKQQKKQSKKDHYLFGVELDSVAISNLNKSYIENNVIYGKTKDKIDKFYKQYIFNLLEIMLLEKYNEIVEDIPKPKLKIRKMKTRWGVCNKRDNSVTLNTNLLYYDKEVVYYVIVHELVHFVHFNHSKDFWDLVETYTPNYKEIRKKLKDY